MTRRCYQSAGTYQDPSQCTGCTASTLASNTPILLTTDPTLMDPQVPPQVCEPGLAYDRVAGVMYYWEEETRSWVRIDPVVAAATGYQYTSAAYSAASPDPAKFVFEGINTMVDPGGVLLIQDGELVVNQSGYIDVDVYVRAYNFQTTIDAVPISVTPTFNDDTSLETPSSALVMDISPGVSYASTTSFRQFVLGGTRLNMNLDITVDCWFMGSITVKWSRSGV